MSLDKKISVKKVEGNGGFEDVKDHKKALADLIKQQIDEKQELKNAVKALNAIEHSASILEAKSRLERMENILLALQEEELPILPEYQERIKELGEEIDEKQAKLPDLITEAIQEMDRDALLTFIDEALSYKKNEEFKYMVENFTDEHRERVYDIIHSEEIKDKDHQEAIHRFESLMGLSMNIIEREYLKDLDPSLEPFRAFIAKYVTKFDGRVNAQLELMKTWKDFNFDERLIARHSESTIRRFGIDKQGEEIAKQAFEEFREILTSIMANK